MKKENVVINPCDRTLEKRALDCNSSNYFSSSQPLISSQLVYWSNFNSLKPICNNRDTSPFSNNRQENGKPFDK
ncbi:hypothetical protein A4A49_40660 [Nicotiana attenuata]|uniref:Uncharacterized protein n=1 Tax=Nicotiana attenuata TaxID=49451 RepID=A0A1J6JPN4_NICAT|nr:hypothetical protein A4A49_40660 [Nicotiana attenuata]